MSRSFSVILIPQPDGGYFVDCPSLPGCHSQGDTKDEAMANIHEAILLVLEDLTAQGMPIPADPKPLLAEVQIAS